MSSVEQSKEIARRWNEEVIGQRKLELLEELIHPDYINHDANIRGVAAAREYFTQMVASGNVSITMEDLIAEGDKVVARWHGSDGDKRYKGITIYRIADSKIIEDWFCAEEIA